MKGGVGKTTLAVNIAYEASSSGLRTLVWDLDPQGSATYILRVKPKLKKDTFKLDRNNLSLSRSIKETMWPLLDLIPSDFNLRRLDKSITEQKQFDELLRKSINTLRKNYDLLIIDNSTSASSISEAVINCSDIVFVPVIPNDMSLHTFNTFESFIKTIRQKKQKPKVFAIFNMVDGRKLLHKQILGKHLGTDSRFLKTTIPASSSIEQMATKRQPAGSFRTSFAVSSSLSALFEEVLDIA